MDEARNALAVQADRPLKHTVDDQCTPELQILTLINGDNPSANIGNGYTHALAWRVCPEFQGQKMEAMEGYVDAQTGQVYRFIDTVEYFQAKGSIFPVTNDGNAPLGVQTVAVRYYTIQSQCQHSDLVASTSPPAVIVLFV